MYSTLLYSSLLIDRTLKTTFNKVMCVAIMYAGAFVGFVKMASVYTSVGEYKMVLVLSVHYCLN